MAPTILEDDRERKVDELGVPVALALARYRIQRAGQLASSA